MNKRERMYMQIKQHGENLEAIFQTGLDPVILAKRLHDIEVSANRTVCQSCNGEITTEDEERLDAITHKKLEKLLQYEAKGIPVFLNGDPRGYTLKIRDEFVKEHSLKIHTDWGGYGILAPEFTGE